MKKLIVALLLCISSAAHSMAAPAARFAQAAAALAAATAPVTVPGTYYYYKSKHSEHGESKKDACEFREFQEGAAVGAFPVANVIVFPEAMNAKPSEKNGFIGGVSLYATMPLYLRYVRNMR